ncbi:MAG: dihydropteroate synthase [Planctomycetales bacterium]|nr:dihydropteroate synthase [Planctomycetales bacterium]
MHGPIEITTTSHLHFVTGTLAQHAVREIVSDLADRHSFEFSIGVMPITVAALMTPQWLIRKLTLPPQSTHLVVPGFCESGLETLAKHVSVPVVLGPNDCRDMAELFGEKREPIDLNRYDIEIIAEINHAPRLAIGQFESMALRLVQDGADRIDIGCDPAKRCDRIADYVRCLVSHGLKVSIDTFDNWEAGVACDAGASLVLSVNSQNRHHAKDWNTEVVAIPDTPTDMDSLDDTIEYLTRHDIPMRLDPILEPIGSGLAASIVRYSVIRQRYPELPMMMGIGNLTELTDVDSAGINMMLLGICQELGIGSVLTTQVINWARSSVRECDHARRLVYAAVGRGIPPKNLSDDLVMLRDRTLNQFSDETLETLAGAIKDNNYRLFAQDGRIHLVSRGLHLDDDDPFRLFENLLSAPISENVDRSHAFYLGYEMAKASIALALGKRYEQDRALRWGFLTSEENLHRLTRTGRHRSRE